MKYTLFLLMACLGSAYANGAATRLQIAQNVDEACRKSVFNSAANALAQFQAQGGSATIGYLEDLPSLLVHAGTSQERAAQINQALKRLRDAAPRIPTLAYTEAVLSRFERQKMLFVCTASADCSFSNVGANTVALGQNQPFAVLVTSSSLPQRPEEWAMSFMGTFGGIATQQLMAEWLMAAWHLEALKKGAGGWLYHQFAGKYDGSFPIAPDERLLSFMLVWMSMGQTLISQDTFVHFRPEDAQENERALTRDVLSVITSQNPHTGIREAINELGLTPQNFLAKAREIHEHMLTIIAAAGSLN